MIEDFAGKMPLLNVTATEILIVRAQKNKSDAVYQALSARVDTLLEQWSGMGEINAAQFALVQNCRIVENGDWSLLVIGEAAEDIINAFSLCLDSYKK